MALGLVSLVFVDLGASRPEVGGSVRWPLYASGRIIGTTFGCTVLLTLLTDTEVLAITTYASHYWPWLYSGSSLSPAGIGVAALIEAALVVLNWYGVRLFARINLVVTWLKFVVPVVTVLALLASGLHASNLTSAGGFAPYGWSAALSAVASGGLVYCLAGGQTPVDPSGEARNPRRDIPRSIIVAIAAAAALYILLQFAYLTAIPHSLLRHGWNGINFTSPFAQLAVVVNLGWLSSVLYADAVLSPAGSEFVGTADGARQSYGLSKNRLLPKYFLSVPGKFGVPRRALVLNFFLGLLVLIPLHSWISIVSFVGDAFLVSYAVLSVAAGAFRRAAATRLSGWIPGIQWIAPVSFILSSEIIYWSGWPDLRVALPVSLFGVVLFFFLRTADRPLIVEIKAGAWFVAYALLLTLLSGIGSYGGQGWIKQPWDSIIVALVSVGIYLWAVRAGAAHIAATATEEVGDSPAVSDALTALALAEVVHAQSGPAGADAAGLADAPPARAAERPDPPAASAGT